MTASNALMASNAAHRVPCLLAAPTLIRDVLVHVRDFRDHTSAADYGVRLAAGVGAAVTGLYASPKPGVAPAYVSDVIRAAITEAARQLVKDAVLAKPGFVEWATSLGAQRAAWLVAEGKACDALAQASAWHDLLVLDRGGDARLATGEIARVILKAGVPCIVVPERARQFSGLKRIAIGWNGSPEAMRTIHGALPLLKGREVLLLRSEEPVASQRVEWTPPFDIVDYLESHDATVTERRILETRDDAGGVLLEEALEFEADLFVIGVYGRSRFSEWMLGGATRYALTWADVPVLLRH